MTTTRERAPTHRPEQEWVDQFLDETTLFLGPDPAIMRTTSMPRDGVRGRLLARASTRRGGPHPQAARGALDEAYEMWRPWVPRPARNGAT